MEWTPNQVVAFNLRRIRLELRLTQEEGCRTGGSFSARQAVESGRVERSRALRRRQTHSPIRC